MKYDIISFMFLLIVAMGAASACSCIAPGTPLEELEKADAVFTGTVTAIDSLDEGTNRVTLRIVHLWKGPEPIYLSVKTAADSAGCGFNFEQGKDYLVYAQASEEGYRVSLCSRTALLSTAQEDLDALGYDAPAPMPLPQEPTNIVVRFFNWVKNIFS